MIWFNDTLPDPAVANAMSRNTLADALGIVIERFDEDSVTGSMPVDARTHQPYGLLHGGASVALAETLGSLGAQLTVDASRYRVVGLDINANHVRGVRAGRVTAVARPYHLGRTTQVWSIEQHDERGKLTCVSRLTMAILDADTGK